MNPKNSIKNLWIKIKSEPTNPLLWDELTEEYTNACMPTQRLYTSQQSSRLSKRQNMDANPEAKNGNQLLNSPITERTSEWEGSLTEWLAECDGDWLSRLYQVRLLDINQNSERQLELIKKCIHQEPIPGESLHWLGHWRLNSGDHSGAIEALAQLVDLRPLRHGSMLYLGEALLREGNTKAAEAAFTRASMSKDSSFLRLMAIKVYNNNYWKEAIKVLERSLSIEPDNLESLHLLKKIHWDAYQLTEAEECCKKIIKLNPNDTQVRYTLNALPGRRGDAKVSLHEIEKQYRDENNPQSRLSSSIAMTSLYVDSLSAEYKAELHRRMCKPIESLIECNSKFNNSKYESRALRIGLVSSDFHRQHPINLFALPLIEKFDQKKLEVVIFYTGTLHDKYTLRARKASKKWVHAEHMDDHELQQTIMGEKIDILIDLAGHTKNHRLGVFALRAAPIQATFLGYPHSTGLSNMDWLIGDSIVTPAAHAHLFSEKIAQLPDSVFCWAPIDHYPIPAPRPQQASIVFGSFNNVMKLSPTTINLWASILRECPESKLLLKAPSLRDNSVARRFENMFEDEGINSKRLHLEGPSNLDQMMQRYGEIDIALDPTPYNGGTTTLQALWMGVPVISLEGNNFASRMGASFLHTLGHKEWVAHNEKEYLSIAKNMINDLQKIRQSRSLLRESMQESSLSNLGEYSQNFSTLLKRIWSNYCKPNASNILIAAK